MSGGRTRQTGGDADFAGRPGPRGWLLIIAIMMAVQVKPWWEPGKDASSYLSIARNIAHGRLASLGQPHLRYAPGYPLVIAPAFWLGDRPFLAISLIHFALMMAFAVGVACWLKPLVGRANWLLTALVMANASLWFYQRQTLSEVGFIAEIVWGALALRRLAAGGSRAGSIGAATAAIVLLSLAGITRQVAVFIVAGFGVTLLWQARQSGAGKLRAVLLTAAIGAPVTLATFGLILYDRQQAAGSDRGDYVTALAEGGAVQHSVPGRLIEGVRLRVSEVGRLLIPGMRKAYSRAGQWYHPLSIFYAILTALVLLGWWRLVRDHPDPLLWALPFYLVFYILWLFDADTRYMLPMLPVFVAAVWVLLERFGRHRATIVLALVVLHAGIATADLIKSRKIADYAAHWPAVDAVRQAVGPDTRPIAAADVDRPVRLMFQFGLDRGIDELPPGEPPEPDDHWLLTPADRPAPPGFTPTLEAGGWRLLQRPAPNAIP